MDYRSLTATELVAEAQRQPVESRAEATQNALAQRAVDLVLAPNAVRQYDTATWQALLRLVESRVTHLTGEQRQQFAALSAQLESAPKGDDWAAIRSRVVVLRAAGDPNRTISQVIENWIRSRGLESLGIDEAAWALRESLPHRTNCTKFSVVWSGFLTAPRSGDYVLSVAPINVNSAFGGHAVRHRLRVQLGERIVVEAGPQEVKAPSPATKSHPQRPEGMRQIAWNWQGVAVPLQAGQAVPLRVEMTYQCEESATLSPPHAVLSWEGPGIDRQVIGNEFLSTPEKTNKGLLAEYQFTINGKVDTVRQPSATIDYAWRTSADVAPVNESLTQQLTAQLWKLATDKDYLARCAAGQVRHVYFQDDSSVEYLTSGQRREFLQVINNSAELLTRIDPDALVRLYRNLRFGSSDLAADLVGRTLQLHADLTPEITSDFYRANRQPYAELGYLMAAQQPDQFRRLEANFLQLRDGRCALPVAYTLSYSYRNADQGVRLAALEAEFSRPARPRTKETGPPAKPAPIPSPFADWRKRLEDKSKDNALSEAARVNWYIARAQAAEVMTAGTGSGSGARENYRAGQALLTEAHLITKEAALRSRIYLEEVARLGAMNQFSLARKVLSAATATAPATAVASWQQAIDTMAAAREAEITASSTMARDAHLAILRERRASASQRGDETSVKRYDALLQQAGGNAN